MYRFFDVKKAPNDLVIRVKKEKEMDNAAAAPNNQKKRKLNDGGAVNANEQNAPNNNNNNNNNNANEEEKENKNDKEEKEEEQNQNDNQQQDAQQQDAQQQIQAAPPKQSKSQKKVARSRTKRNYVTNPTYLIYREDPLEWICKADDDEEKKKRIKVVKDFGIKYSFNFEAYYMTWFKDRIDNAAALGLLDCVKKNDDSDKYGDPTSNEALLKKLLGQ